MVHAHKLVIPEDSNERLFYIKRMFPQAVGVSLSDEWRGGRNEAIKRLNTISLDSYNRNRHFINGSVTKLSPYFRHGCISLKEAADSIIYRFGDQSQKIIFQLAWRDYWHRVWYWLGDGIYSDIEAPKVRLGDNPLPDYIRQGITGLPCMDGVIRDLTHDGYVHNHARMWFAAYVLHWLKVDWREAADWFENYLLDGDKASNHLSWQWIASTFSSKPYYFNKENLARFTGEKYCSNCKVECPFDATYEQLVEKLFTLDPGLTPQKRRIPIMPREPLSTHTAKALFVHDEMLSAANPLTRLSLTKFFVFDTNLHAKWPLKRLQFVADCLSEMPEVEVWIGNTSEVLKERGVGKLVTQSTPNQQVRQLLSPFETEWRPEKVFTEEDIGEKRLVRFSRYWDKVGEALFGNTIFQK